MQIKILITSTEVKSRQWKSPRTGDIVDFHSQTAYVEGLAQFPQEIELPLESKHPYHEGEYSLAPDAIEIYNKKLQLKRNFTLVPLAHSKK